MYGISEVRNTACRCMAGIATASALLLAAPVWGADAAQWQKVVEAAKKEGSVTIYSGQGLDQMTDLAARFKKEYGIAVQVVRAVDAELLTKVDAEFSIGRGTADIVVSADLGAVKDRNAKGYVVAPLGPDFDKPIYDKATRIPEGTYFETSAAILTFIWNKDLYPKGIKDYPDVLDPVLAEKIGVIGVVTKSQVDFYQYLGENYGADFVRKLAALKPRIYGSALPMGQAVVSGEIAVALYAQPLVDEVNKGAPVAWGLPPKPYGARFWGLVLKRAPHPNAAQVLANFMVTQQGQEAVARIAGSVLPNVKGAISTTTNVRRQDLTSLTTEFVAQYRQKWNAMMLNR